MLFSHSIFCSKTVTLIAMRSFVWMQYAFNTFCDVGANLKPNRIQPNQTEPKWIASGERETMHKTSIEKWEKQDEMNANKRTKSHRNQVIVNCFFSISPQVKKEIKTKRYAEYLQTVSNNVARSKENGSKCQLRTFIPYCLPFYLCCYIFFTSSSLFASLLRQVDEWVNVLLILIPGLFLYVRMRMHKTEIAVVWLVET